MMKKVLMVLFVFLGSLLSTICAFEQTLPWAEKPTYQFRSTSTIASTVGGSYTPAVAKPFASQNAPASRPRRAMDPDDDEIGNIPVGEPTVLLLLAMLYMLCRAIRLYVWKTGKN